jgi:hypothetical protein
MEIALTIYVYALLVMRSADLASSLKLPSWIVHRLVLLLRLGMILGAVLGCLFMITATGKGAPMVIRVLALLDFAAMLAAGCYSICLIIKILITPMPVLQAEADRAIGAAHAEAKWAKGMLQSELMAISCVCLTSVALLVSMVLLHVGNEEHDYNPLNLLCINIDNIANMLSLAVFSGLIFTGQPKLARPPTSGKSAAQGYDTGEEPNDAWVAKVSELAHRFMILEGMLISTVHWAEGR